MAMDCPVPMTCNNCGEEGHVRKDCEKAGQVDRNHIADMPADVAWEKIKVAAKMAAETEDLDDVIEGVQEYLKALDGQSTYREVQEGLIADGIEVWLIPLETAMEPAWTNVDLQGVPDKKYKVNIRTKKTPARARERDGWPESTEEILSRLDDAGQPALSNKPRCYNCSGWGHVSKDCPEPKMERNDEPKLCPNCNGEGHRLRDCESSWSG